MFIKYSSSQIPPKKSRGKGSQGKKIADNIIPNPDVALELGKSISLAEPEEEEAAKQVHATHARIVTEFIPESAKKKTGSKSLKPKLKGVQSLTPAKKKPQTLCKLLKKARRPARDSQVLEAQVEELVLYQGFLMSPQSSLSHPAKAETQGVTRQASSQHIGFNNRE
ncbi:hypothetical protein Tco_0046628 [Tanacetum coccineum]